METPVINIGKSEPILEYLKSIEVNCCVIPIEELVEWTDIEKVVVRAITKYTFTTDFMTGQAFGL